MTQIHQELFSFNWGFQARSLLHRLIRTQPPVNIQSKDFLSAFDEKLAKETSITRLAPKKLTAQWVQMVELWQTKWSTEKTKSLDLGDFHKVSSIGLPYSIQPAMYFTNPFKKCHPEPIEYLLTETLEFPKEENVDEICQFVKKSLPMKGTLCQTPKGQLYLDIDDSYIHSLIAFIHHDWIMKPPYFHLANIPEGAHVNVITDEEIERKNIGEIRELGKEIYFNVEGLYSIRPDNWREMERVWFLKIQSKELEDLREYYHLSPHIQGHHFHIVIAVQPSYLPLADKRLPTMRINIAFLAA